MSESYMKLYNRDGTEMTKEQIDEMMVNFKKSTKENLKKQKHYNKKIKSLKETIIQTDWLKNLLLQTDEIYKNYTNKDIDTLYFSQLNKFRENFANKKYEECFAISQAINSTLKYFIESQYEQYELFQIKTMPTIPFGLNYSTVLALKGQRQNFIDIINGFPETKLIYGDDIENIERKFSIVNIINELLKEYGKYELKELVNNLNIFEKYEILNSVNDMEKYNVIIRTNDIISYKRKI